MEVKIPAATQIGEVLQGWRKERKLTQAQLGAKVGLSQVAVSHLEQAPEKTSVERLFRLLSALEVDLVLRDRASSSGDSESSW